MISNSDISSVGIKEKYIRRQHYNTIKVWWARRPVMAMRAIIMNEILRQNSKQSNLSDSLVYELNPPKRALKNFANLYETKKIKLLDVFSGGGSIPFESARLGLDTYSAELNPIATLLQKTIFDSLPIDKYPEKLRETAYQIISNAEKRLAPMFEINGIFPYVIFWGKTAKCKACKKDFSLSRLRYLSKKKGKTIVFSKEEAVLKNGTGKEKPSRLSKDFVCSNCGQEHSFADIKKFCRNHKLGKTPLVICHHNQGKKEYLVVSDEIKKTLEEKEDFLAVELKKLAHLIPDENVLCKSGVINPTLYDLKQPSDYFNNRQLVVLLTLIDEIIQSWKELELKEGEITARQVLFGLTSMIEFLVDWNSKSTMWIPQNEQTGRSLVGPGVGMKWDYIEINPFYLSGSNLRSKIDRVVSTFSSISINSPVTIINGSSTGLPLKDNDFDLIVTDPPYYDSVDYTALSEFFRPWFEAIIKNTFDPNVSLKNDTDEEAIVELTKSGKKKKSATHYKKIMLDVLRESHRVLKPDGVCLLLYSHKTLEGWEVIAEAFKEAGFYVDSCDALDMERIARPRAMSYQALNGVVVFRLVKQKEGIEPVSKTIEEINTLIASKDLEESNIPIFLAAQACKLHCLSNSGFRACYQSVINHYEKARTKNFDSVDALVNAYLSAYQNPDFVSLGKAQVSLLKDNGLVNGDDKLVSLSEVQTELINGSGEVFLEVISLFKENKYNSSTKIILDGKVKNNAIVFYRTIGGNELNTVKKRSSDQDQKISRLILSKIC